MIFGGNEDHLVRRSEVLVDLFEVISVGQEEVDFLPKYWVYTVRLRRKTTVLEDLHTEKSESSTKKSRRILRHSVGYKKVM